MPRPSLLSFPLLRLALSMVLGDGARAGMIGFGVLLSSALMMRAPERRDA